MSDIVDELSKTFRESCQNLQRLATDLDKLESAQKLVETLSSNLIDAAHSLDSTAQSHSEFIDEAKETNRQLGEVITVLQGLDTQTITTSLTNAIMGIEANKSMLQILQRELDNYRDDSSKAVEKVDALMSSVEALSKANDDLSSELSDARQALTKRTDDVSLLVRSKHSSLILLLLVCVVASMTAVLKQFGLIPF